MPTGMGLSREPLATAAERIVGILKRTDFEDHCQALTPWLCERSRPEGWARVDEDRESVDGLGLAEAIEALRDDLLKARAAGGTSDIQLPVESMTVELTVTATREANAKAGFRVPFVPVEVGGGGSRERGTGQKVTVVFGGPVDREGRPVKVAQATSELKR
jgi:Trypsin-co-occurring domain 2